MPELSPKAKDSALRTSSKRWRRFRLWEKKRGSHRTDTTWLGGAGETLFFACLFLIGTFALTELLVLLVQDSRPGFLQSTWGLTLGILMLASLVLTGLVGTVYNVVLIGTSAERRAALAKRAQGSDLLADAQASPKEFPCVPKDANWTISPGIRLAYRLPIASSPSWRLLILSTFCLLWNGAVAVLAVLAINQGGEVFSPLQIFSFQWWTVFRLVVVGYALLGAGIVYVLFNMLVAAAAIGPTSVEVSALPLHPGGDYEVFLSQAGHLRIEWLELRLLCDEEVSFTDGTDTRTEVRNVYDQLIFRQEGFQISDSAPFQHTCPLDVPPSAMHSFLSEHNAVVWKLRVQAEAKNWPPFTRTFPLIVYPATCHA